MAFSQMSCFENLDINLVLKLRPDIRDFPSGYVAVLQFGTRASKSVVSFSFLNNVVEMIR